MAAPDQSAASPALFRIGVIATGVVLGILVLVSGMAETANRNKQHTLAVGLFGDSGNGWARLASAYSADEESDAAVPAAEKALDKSLSHVRALRVYGVSKFEEGDEETGREILRRTANLSWRDSVTHAWLFERELIEGNYDQAMDHADSLLRRGRQEERIFEILTLAVLDERLLNPIVTQFEKEALWRERFFASAGRMSPNQYRGFRTLIASLKESRAPVTREEMRPFANALVENNQAVDAIVLWDENFPADSDNGTRVLAWPESEQIMRPRPDDWRLTNNRNMRPRVRENNSLEVAVTTSARGEIAWRYYRAKGGPIALELPTDMSDSDGNIRIGARCLPDGEKSYASRVLGSNRWTLNLSAGCSLYRLSVDLPLGGYEGDRTLDLPAPTLRD